MRAGHVGRVGVLGDVEHGRLIHDHDVDDAVLLRVEQRAPEVRLVEVDRPGRGHPRGGLPGAVGVVGRHDAEDVVAREQPRCRATVESMPMSALPSCTNAGVLYSRMRSMVISKKDRPMRRASIAQFAEL